MNSDFDSLLGEFIENLLIEKHASKATREVYGREVACFLNYLEEKTLELETVSTADLKQYLICRSEDEGRNDDSLSPKTMARVITVLKAFFSYLQDSGIRKVDEFQSRSIGKGKWRDGANVI